MQQLKDSHKERIQLLKDFLGQSLGRREDKSGLVTSQPELTDKSGLVTSQPELTDKSAQVTNRTDNAVKSTRETNLTDTTVTSALVTSQTDATAVIKAEDGQLNFATAEELAETEDTATAAMETSHGETHKDTVGLVGSVLL